MNWEQKITDLKIKFLNFQETKPLQNKKRIPPKAKTELSKIVYHYFGLSEVQNFICKKKMK